MPNYIYATPTVDALEFLPKYYQAGGATLQKVNMFRIGMGGWETSALGDVPRTPDPTLRNVGGPSNTFQDIDIKVDPFRTPSASRRYASLDPLPSFAGNPGYYEGTLAAGDQAFESPSTLLLTCLLPSFAGPGGYYFWEIGIFSVHPVSGGQNLMLAYGTFPRQLYTGVAGLTSYVRLSFGRL